MIGNKGNTITQSHALEIFDLFKCPTLICPSWTFSLSMIFSPSFPFHDTHLFSTAFVLTDFVETATVDSTIAIISGVVSSVAVVSVFAIVIICLLKRSKRDVSHQGSSGSHSDDLTKESTDEPTIDTVPTLGESTLFASLLDDGHFDWQTQSGRTSHPVHDTLYDD
jgi:hypothetical protein